LLAQGSEYQRLKQTELTTLNQAVDALIKHDSDEFIRHFLAALRNAGNLGGPNTQDVLRS
jgi:predicted nucleic acid-binding OB-fold protein